MILAANIILIAISIAIIAPMAAFALECFLAIWPRRLQPAVVTNRHPRTVVLIPAHNEELVLEQSLRVLIPTLSAGDRVLVIADNCHDQTAEVARAAGAEVLSGWIRRGGAKDTHWISRCIISVKARPK